MLQASRYGNRASGNSTEELLIVWVLLRDLESNAIMAGCGATEAPAGVDGGSERCSRACGASAAPWSNVGQEASPDEAY